MAVERAIADVGLFVDPPSHHLEGDRLFDAESNIYAGDRIQEPYAYLRSWFAERGIPVHTGDRLEDPAVRCRRRIYVSMGYRRRWRHLVDQDDLILSGFFANECPLVEPQLFAELHEVSSAFRRVYCYSDADSLHPFLRGAVSLRQHRIPQSFNQVHADLWHKSDRRFLVMINANKRSRVQFRELYTERQRAVEYFSRNDEIDLYGVGWDQPSFRMGGYLIGGTRLPRAAQTTLHGARTMWQRVSPDPLLVAARRAWRGTADSKSEVLAGHDFALCFENMILPGWITEKLFDCLFTGTIPIYLGDPRIERIVPPECFVDMRKFADYGELRDYLRSMPAKEKAAYREAGRAYVGSQAYQPFTKEAFVGLFAGMVSADADIAL